MAPVNSSVGVCCFLLVSSEPAFSARFFLVVVELTPIGRSLLHMWHLQLRARPVTLGKCFKRTTSIPQELFYRICKNVPHFCVSSLSDEMAPEKEVNTASPMNSSQFTFDMFGSPGTPVMKNKPRTSNLQSACRLSLTTRRVYSQELALPEGVEAITVTPSAG